MFLWPGKISIEISKTNYLSNENIQGSVKLELEKDISAKAVRIRLIGIRGSGKHRRLVHEQTIVLDSANQYFAGTKVYQFSFDIPVFRRMDTSGFGPLKGLIDIFNGDPYSYIGWSLDASLDIPNTLDVNQVKQIYIKEAQNSDIKSTF